MTMAQKRKQKHQKPTKAQSNNAPASPSRLKKSPQRQVEGPRRFGENWTLRIWGVFVLYVLVFFEHICGSLRSPVVVLMCFEHITRLVSISSRVQEELSRLFGERFLEENATKRTHQQRRRARRFAPRQPPLCSQPFCCTFSKDPSPQNSSILFFVVCPVMTYFSQYFLRNATKHMLSQVRQTRTVQ